MQAGDADLDSRPAGVVVFRRGKLSMKQGMSQEAFTQVGPLVWAACCRSGRSQC